LSPLHPLLVELVRVAATLLGAVTFSILLALLGREVEAAIRALTLGLLRRTERRLPIKERSRFRKDTFEELQQVSRERPLWALVRAAYLFHASMSGQRNAALEAPGTTRSSVESAPASNSISLLKALKHRIASPSELAAELERPLDVVMYAMRLLEKCDAITLVDTGQRRGAVEHFYQVSSEEIENLGYL
jgi:hypothetical protein